ncbi:protein of unknown function [Jannaschia seohaensis]|uniref:Uncharacterized protein DUF1127 n=2 Tax=Jannaschia seohaensis TaxID=475081 RepID=A0A2Y9B8Q0_9RHOB|nr:uncharacterized protein DUF1127 [Jannaschia seohaensis]SSA50599.1 protein of unknown function [Jannaschia seohaensis]
MANTAFGSSIRTDALRHDFGARLSALREAWGRWRLYRRTHAELSKLSNRDLADLGLNRSMIKSIAMDAAYGKRG